MQILHLNWGSVFDIVSSGKRVLYVKAVKTTFVKTAE